MGGEGDGVYAAGVWMSGIGSGVNTVGYTLWGMGVEYRVWGIHCRVYTVGYGC